MLARPVLEALLADSGWELLGFSDEAPVGDMHVDHVAELGSGPVRACLLIETKLRPRLGAARSAVRMLQHIAQDKGPSCAIALFTDRVTSGLARELRSLGVGYLDIYGKCYLRWPGLFVDRPGSDRPLLQIGDWPQVGAILEAGLDRVSAHNVLGPRPVMRHRVVRAMLSEPERRWHQKELAGSQHVDAGSHVHRVLSFLLQEHYADYAGKGPNKVVFLVRPGELLDAWAQQWGETWGKLRRTSATFYSATVDPDEVALELAAAAYDVGSQLGFTLASGAGYFGAYMRDDHVHAYVSQNVQAVARTADLEPVERGANVTLIPAKDEGFYYLPAALPLRRPLPDVRNVGPVCPVQLYLDMRAAGGRYAEQAGRLREEVLRY